ncbi:MAG: sugar phosphate isomerase/epimerase [Anaerolineaceae bacterium]|nr:sugar phosphate isomerase/epimerase [Anaerolineaceae bacterium]
MKLGINSYTYMWSIGFHGANPAYPDKNACPSEPLTAIGLLEKANQLGIHLVQTGPNLGFDRLSTKEQEEFIRRAGELGIELESGTRGLDFNHMAQQINLAKRMGAKLIRTLPEIDGQYAADARIIPRAVEPLIPLLEREKICLGIENGRIPAADLRAALDQINSPYVGIVLDMVNSLAVPEGWKEATCQLAPHTMCVHYKDFTIRRAWHMMGFICDGTPSGKGMVETGWLLDTLKTSPYDFNVIIELWVPEQDTLDETIALEQAWAVESVSYLRRFMP